MNTFIWILQVLLAAFFLMPAFMKLTTAREKLVEKNQLEPGASAVPVRTIGFLELLGSIGIIVPCLTGIMPVLTPLAAVGFSIVMLGAFVVHYKKHDYKVFPLLGAIFILSVTVAYYRFNG